MNVFPSFRLESLSSDLEKGLTEVDQVDRIEIAYREVFVPIIRDERLHRPLIRSCRPRPYVLTITRGRQVERLTSSQCSSQFLPQYPPRSSASSQPHSAYERWPRSAEPSNGSPSTATCLHDPLRGAFGSCRTHLPDLGRTRRAFPTDFRVSSRR